ncbi:MAG: cbiQ [Burkholderiaceae bacterium]|nr:cbiQ [Burkholderiaceae bacterium]
MNNAKPTVNSPASRQWPAARNWLLLYLASVVIITFIHHPAILAILLASALLFSGNNRWRHLRRTMLAILAFNLTISVGYAAVALWQGTFSASYLLLVNLRTILMVFLGFWFTARIPLLDALAGWNIASLLATLAIGQIKTFERILADFRAAFESRNLARPSWLARSRHTAAQAQTLLDKSFAASNEAAQAMRSRGVFDD